MIRSSREGAALAISSIERADVLFNLHIFVNSLDHQVGVGKILKAGNRADKLHLLLHGSSREIGVFQEGFDFEDGLLCQREIDVKEQNRNANSNATHCNSRSHQPRSNNTHRIDFEGFDVSRVVNNLARKALSEKDMLKRSRLGMLHQFAKPFSLKSHAGLKVSGTRSLNALQDRERGNLAGTSAGNRFSDVKQSSVVQSLNNLARTEPDGIQESS